jgi:hypothetical protein
MKNHLHFLVWLTLASWFSTASAATVYLPTLYQSRADSPFYSGIQAGTIAVEDFEDGASNTPGLMIAGSIRRDSYSVDADDGLIDDFGRGNYMGDLGGFPAISMNFAANLLGVYPDYVGLVLLRMNFTSTEPVSDFLQAYDAAGHEIALQGQINIRRGPDAGQYDARYHRFMGLHHPGGISRLVIPYYIGGVDHVQFGTMIPEPGSALLAALALSAAALRRRRA